MSFRASSKLLFRSCQSVFGETATYHSKEKGELEVRGILSQPYTLVKEAGFDSEISTSQTVFEIQESDLGVKPALQDRMKLGDYWYKIVNLEPNQEGQIKLILKRVDRINH
jgi:hypothetical protein